LTTVHKVALALYLKIFSWLFRFHGYFCFDSGILKGHWKLCKVSIIYLKRCHHSLAGTFDWSLLLGYQSFSSGVQLKFNLFWSFIIVKYYVHILFRYILQITGIEFLLHLFVSFCGLSNRHYSYVFTICICVFIHTSVKHLVPPKT